MQALESDVPATNLQPHFFLKTGKSRSMYTQLEKQQKVHFSLLEIHLQSHLRFLWNFIHLGAETKILSSLFTLHTPLVKLAVSVSVISVPFPFP